MAVKFDGINSAYTFPGGVGASTFPDSDWCVGFYLKIDDNVGTFWQYVISTRNAVSSTDGFSIFIPENSTTNARKLACRMNNSTTVTIFDIVTPRENAADGIGKFWFFQRSGSDFRVYSVIPGEYPILENELLGLTTWTTTPSGEWFSIGKRNDESVDRYLKGDMAEVFKGDFSLSTNEMFQLAIGKNLFDLGRSPRLYLPLHYADSPAQNNGIKVTSPIALKEGNPVSISHPESKLPFILKNRVSVVIPGASMNIVEEGSTAVFNLDVITTTLGIDLVTTVPDSTTNITSTFVPSTSSISISIMEQGATSLFNLTSSNNINSNINIIEDGSVASMQLDEIINSSINIIEQGSIANLNIFALLNSSINILEQGSIANLNIDINTSGRMSINIIEEGENSVLYLNSFTTLVTPVVRVLAPEL